MLKWKEWKVQLSKKSTLPFHKQPTGLISFGKKITLSVIRALHEIAVKWIIISAIRGTSLFKKVITGHSFYTFSWNMAVREAAAPITPLHIVEDHNHALEHIYRAIGRKKLPFSGTCLVHFDAHPDLLSPENMPSELVYSKQELFDCLNIADWILPAIYAGHFGSVIWIKPSWSSQIPDGRYELTVGRHKEDGLIK